MPTIGAQLKQAREARGLTIKQVLQATRIRTHYLEAMEADDFAVMPSAAQARGFLRSYAEFLGLNAEELIQRQRTEANAPAEFSAPASATLPPAPPAVEKAPPPPQPVEEPPAPEVENYIPELPPPLVTTPEPAAIEPLAPLLVSQQIYLEIGNGLRQRRELLSLTYDEIERHTHVRKHYLHMIEDGDFKELPSPVQARGMLSTYASFLDMDSEAILLRFADALQARRVEKQVQSPQKSSLPRARTFFPLWLRRFISPDLIFGGGMILLLFLMSVWFAVRILNTQAAEASPTTGPSISDVLLATQATVSDLVTSVATGIAEIGTPLPELDAGTPTDTALPPTQASAVQITLSILERTFLRVIVDGEIKQDGRVAPGAALTFDGAERIEVLTGSGAAVQVIFNQQDQGVMGSFGEVVDTIYTVNGMETPTPTASPTPSITPRPSRTSPPTLTLRPSSTPRPTITPRPSRTPTPGDQ